MFDNVRLLHTNSSSEIFEQMVLIFIAVEPVAVTTVMQTDIMLSKGNTVLIIDAKYYGHTTQSQYGVHTLHSGNLYQVFTYVKNKDAEFGNEPHTVSGMLLYAQTDEVVQPNHIYHMSGNKISVRTLDLNCPFKEIAEQLDMIIDEHF